MPKKDGATFAEGPGFVTTLAVFSVISVEEVDLLRLNKLDVGAVAGAAGDFEEKAPSLEVVACPKLNKDLGGLVERL